VLGAANLYRAATQSIAIDEAFAYNLYLTRPLAATFTEYDAANHVLYTLLTRVSVGLFGASEFSLRLPSLLGGLLYFVAVYRLAGLLLGQGGYFLLGVTVLSVNPFLLDFLTAARGYGLALGLFAWALYQLAHYLGPLTDARGSAEPEAYRLRRAGIGFGLSAAANLTLIFPITAFVIVLGVLLAFDRDSGGAPAGRRAWRLVDHLALPALVAASLFLLLPLANATMKNFYVGVGSLGATSESLVFVSLFYQSAGNPPDHSVATRFFAHRVIPAALLVLGLGGASILWTWLRRRSLSALAHLDRYLLLHIGGMAVTLLLLEAAHAVAGVNYPERRTGLYWIFLFLLPIAALAKKMDRRRRWLAAPLVIVLAACAGRFVSQANLRYYHEWPWDAGTRRIVAEMRAREQRDPRKNVRVGGTWLVEPSLNFYRHAWRLDWMKPVVRGDPDQEFDYYVLLPGDAGVIARRGLKILLKDELSQAVLASR